MSAAPPESKGPPAVLGLIGFGVAVACYFYDPVLGIRAAGVDALVVSVFWFRSGRIPYGVRGRPAVGYRTGVAAVAVSLLMALIGLFCLLEPHLVLPLLVSRKFSKPL